MRFLVRARRAATTAGCIFAAALLVSLLSSAALAEQVKRFRFDGGFSGDSGLTFSFSRPVGTYLRDGMTVGEDVPRYAPATTIAGAPSFENVRVTSNPTRILASGLDHDGQTPLLVVADWATGTIDVFSVEGEALLRAEQGGPGRTRTQMSGDGIGDLLQGTIPARAYVPTAGTIAHGLIVLVCTVYHDEVPPLGQWAPASTAFVTSQDRGLTWWLSYEGEAVSLGVPRGNTWSMQNWWPLERVARPLEAYFAAADYRHNPWSDGGRAFVFRARRGTPGATWSIEPAVVVYSEQGGEPGRSHHFHSAAVVPFGANGMRVVTSIGDDKIYSRIVSSSRDDREYATPGWITHDAFHGTAGDASDPGRWGNQYVGAAPGTLREEILAGSDLATETLIAVDTSDPGSSHPRTRFVHGLQLADGKHLAKSYFLRTPMPEQGGPYSAMSNSIAAGDPEVPVSANRLLFSPDGIRWAQALAPSSIEVTGCIHGEHLYVDDLTGLARSRLPELRTRRPLVVGPGGMQRALDQPVWQSAQGGAITPLARAHDGRWMLDGQALDPQPPSAGQVFRLQASRLAPSMEIGSILPAGNATDVGSALGTDALQLRVWAQNRDPGAAADAWLQLRAEGSASGIAQTLRANSTGTWLPLVFTGSLSRPAGARLHLRLTSSYCCDPGDIDLLLAIDTFCEGAGFPGYALPMDPVLPAVVATFPDEIASIRGLAGSGAWTVTLAAQLPEDAWDGTVQGVSAWPLATLWGNDANYVELLADTADPHSGRVLARVVRDGTQVGSFESSPLFWLRGSPVLVSIADGGDGAGLAITVAAAGNPPEEMTLAPESAPAFLSVSCSEIRLGSHHGTTGAGNEVRVSPLLWWGGEIREGEALGPAQRREQLVCLPFLDAGSSPAPDGDLVCGARDNCPAVANADQADRDEDGLGDACDPDLDGDGVANDLDNCPAYGNPGQGDRDADLEGDHCDLDDGVIFLAFDSRVRLVWQTEVGSSAWNLYAGDLDELAATGLYTQVLGSNPLAARHCALVTPWSEEVLVPPAGKAAFLLVTGVADGLEGTLGSDSTGAERGNANPCP